MATSTEVLGMLIPNGGYIQVGTEYEGIDFIECEPITKAEYEAGFDLYDSWKAERDKLASESKLAIFAKLGITADEAELLLG